MCEKEREREHKFLMESTVTLLIDFVLRGTANAPFLCSIVVVGGASHQSQNASKLN